MSTLVASPRVSRARPFSLLANQRRRVRNTGQKWKRLLKSKNYGNACFLAVRLAFLDVAAVGVYRRVDRVCQDEERGGGRAGYNERDFEARGGAGGCSGREDINAEPDTEGPYH